MEYEKGLEMKKYFGITVRHPREGGHQVQTHKVDGSGSGIINCRLAAINQLRKSFPMKGGHEIVGIKEVHK